MIFNGSDSVRGVVGQAMQRLFDSVGVFKACYSDIEPFLECRVSEEDALHDIDFYNKNIDLLKWYRS